MKIDITEEWFGSEIDEVADDLNVDCEELRDALAGDLEFWIPTDQSYVTDEVVIVRASPEELSVPDKHRDAVQRVHNMAAERITRGEDYVVEGDVYVAPRTLSQSRRTTD